MSTAKKSAGRKSSTWTEAERAVLDPYKARFREATKEERKDLLEKEILHKFLQLHPNAEGANRELLKRKVKDWYSNNCRRGLRPSKYTLLPPATFAKVLLYEKREEIEAAARERTDLNPGHPEYMAHYRAARAQITNELGDAGRQEIEKKRAEWNTKGWPPEKQQREAEKNGHQYSKQIDELRYKRMGMRNLTWAWYMNQKGELGVELLDNNPTLGSRPVVPFEKKFPKEVKDMFAAVWEYAKYIQVEEGLESPENNTPMHVVGTGRRPLPGLVKSAAGFPVLPPIIEEEKKLQFRKDLLRALLTEYYVIATGRPKSAVPWQDIQEDPDSWYESKYWPEGVPFRDPSKLKEHEIDSVLAFFRTRVMTEPDDLFRWKRVANGARGRYTYEIATYPTDMTDSTRITPPSVPEGLPPTCAPDNVEGNLGPELSAGAELMTKTTSVAERAVRGGPNPDLGIITPPDNVVTQTLQGHQAENNCSLTAKSGDEDLSNIVPLPESFLDQGNLTHGKEAIGFMTTSTNPSLQIPLHGPASGYLPYPESTDSGASPGQQGPTLQVISGQSNHIRTRNPELSITDGAPLPSSALDPSLSTETDSANTNQLLPMLRGVPLGNNLTPETMAAVLSVFQILQQGSAPTHYVDPSLLSMGHPFTAPPACIPQHLPGLSPSRPSQQATILSVANIDSQQNNVPNFLAQSSSPNPPTSAATSGNEGVSNENSNLITSKEPSKKRRKVDDLADVLDGTGRGLRNKVPKINPDFVPGPPAKKGRYIRPSQVKQSQGNKPSQEIENNPALAGGSMQPRLTLKIPKASVGDALSDVRKA